MLGTVDQTDCRIFLPPGEVIVPDCDAAAVLGIDDRETGEPGLKPAGIDEPVPADDERIDRESINQLVVERLHEVSFETDTSVIRSPPAPGIMRNNGVDLQNGLGRPAAGSHRAESVVTDHDVARTSRFEPVVGVTANAI